MRPLRPWVLLGIPLVAELSRLSDGTQNLTTSTVIAVALASSAFAGLLWHIGRNPSDRSHHQTIPLKPAEEARQQELEELRREQAHLRWVADWQERLLQRTGEDRTAPPSHHRRSLARKVPSGVRRR